MIGDAYEWIKALAAGAAGAVAASFTFVVRQDRRVTNVETYLAAMKEDFAATKEKSAENGERLARVETNVDAIKTSVDRCERKIDRALSGR